MYAKDLIIKCGESGVERRCRKASRSRLKGGNAIKAWNNRGFEYLIYGQDRFRPRLELRPSSCAAQRLSQLIGSERSPFPATVCCALYPRVEFGRTGRNKKGGSRISAAILLDS
jgi:hypothetical protein